MRVSDFHFAGVRRHENFRPPAPGAVPIASLSERENEFHCIASILNFKEWILLHKQVIAKKIPCCEQFPLEEISGL